MWFSHYFFFFFASFVASGAFFLISPIFVSPLHILSDYMEVWNSYINIWVLNLNRTDNYGYFWNTYDNKGIIIVLEIVGEERKKQEKGKGKNQESDARICIAFLSWFALKR